MLCRLIQYAVSFESGLHILLWCCDRYIASICDHCDPRASLNSSLQVKENVELNSVRYETGETKLRRVVCAVTTPGLCQGLVQALCMSPEVARLLIDEAHRSGCIYLLIRSSDLIVRRQKLIQLMTRLLKLIEEVFPCKLLQAELDALSLELEVLFAHEANWRRGSLSCIVLCMT